MASSHCNYNMSNTQKCKAKGCTVKISIGRKKYCDAHPSAKATSQRLKTEERAGAGQCKSCNQPICAKSSVFCTDHLIANRERGVKDRERRKKLGLCRSCNKPISDKSNTWCDYHHEKQNELSRKLAEKARQGEMCVDCNKVPRMLRKKRCASCQVTYQELQANTCRRTGCDEPTELKYFCRKHGNEENEKLKSRRQQLKADNKCIFCFNQITDSDKETPHILCLNCREKQKEQRKATVAA